MFVVVVDSSDLVVVIVVAAAVVSIIDVADADVACLVDQIV